MGVKMIRQVATLFIMMFLTASCGSMVFGHKSSEVMCIKFYLDSGVEPNKAANICSNIYASKDDELKERE
jgi:hypothetical protein